MSLEDQKFIVESNMLSYQKGFIDACEILFDGFKDLAMINQNTVFSLNEVRLCIEKAIEIQAKQKIKS